MTEDYVELHATSAFSFLEAASPPEKLIEHAVKLQIPAAALLDRNGVYGAVRFNTSAKRNGMRAHVGAEVTVSDLGSRVPPPSWLPHQYKPEPVRLPLLCESHEGYQNLCQLITKFNLRAISKQDGTAQIDDLERYASGLVCLTGGDEGPLAAALVRGGEGSGRELVERLIRIFGKSNVYIEIQRHQDREEEWRNQAAIRIAQTYKLPVLATNGVRHATKHDCELLDLFTAIRSHTELDRAGRLLCVNSQRHLRSAREMMSLFKDVPGAVANTREVSSRLRFELSNLGYEFPHYPVPEGETMDSFLRKRVAEGVIRRYGPKRDAKLLMRAKKQVERELALISKLEFAGYFLIVWDIARFCKENGSLVQGRGSAANSVTCYALEITAVDPIGTNLLFERFLSDNRSEGEWPDIDLDLPSGDKREQTVQYIYRRYGELGAAMTANVITYRGKAAARDVGKALGFDKNSLQRLASLVAHFEWHESTDTLAHSFMNAGFDLKHPRIAKFLELCMRIQDMPRHLGQHSGGMVISRGKLDRIVPLERASMQNRTVIQWDKEDCADMRIIKVDLLGLGMMAVLKDCEELVQSTYVTGMERFPGTPELVPVTFDLARLSHDDQVFSTVQRADTVGMFQIESRAQMASLPVNKPSSFYDLVIQVAIIRPGPIAGRMANPYMRRKQGIDPVTYPHPLLIGPLEKTKGVPLFQEQLIRMAMTVGKFSGADADELRRAVGMRRSWERMKNLEARLRAGMLEQGIDSETQDEIWQQISSFALYGFPESHAASFALIAYASAFIKVHYPEAFTCAMLNNQPMGFYSAAVVVKDAQRHGVQIKPIDIQSSDWTCTLEKGAEGGLYVRLGLCYAKGLRESTARLIVAARGAVSCFRSLQQLVALVPILSMGELELLARVGALDTIRDLLSRRDALWQVRRAGKPEGSLLRELATDEIRSPLIPMSTEERLVSDYAGTGLTIDEHPMAYKREALRRNKIVSTEDLKSMTDGEWIRVAGCVIARQRPGTAKGFIFLSMEDETGIGNVIITPELYRRERLLVTRSKFLFAEGWLQNRSGVIHVKAVRLAQLDDVVLS